MAENIFSNIQQERNLSVKNIKGNYNELINLSKNYPNVIFYSQTDEVSDDYGPDIYLGGKRYTRVHGVNPNANRISIEKYTISLRLNNITGLLSLEIDSSILAMWLVGIDLTSTGISDPTQIHKQLIISGNSLPTIINNKSVIYNKSNSGIKESGRIRYCSNKPNDQFNLLLGIISSAETLPEINFVFDNEKYLTTSSAKPLRVEKDTAINSLYSRILNTVDKTSNDNGGLFDDIDSDSTSIKNRLFVCSIPITINKAYQSGNVNIGTLGYRFENLTVNNNDYIFFTNKVQVGSIYKDYNLLIHKENNQNIYDLSSINIVPTIKSFNINRASIVHNAGQTGEEVLTTIPTSGDNSTNITINIPITINQNNNNYSYINAGKLLNNYLYYTTLSPTQTDTEDNIATQIFNSTDVPKGKIAVYWNIYHTAKTNSPNNNIYPYNTAFLRYIRIYQNKQSVGSNPPNCYGYLSIADGKNAQITIQIQNIGNLLSEIKSSLHLPASYQDEIYGLSVSLYSNIQSDTYNDVSDLKFKDKPYLPKMPVIPFISTSSDKESLMDVDDRLIEDFVSSFDPYFVTPTFNVSSSLLDSMYGERVDISKYSLDSDTIHNFRKFNEIVIDNTKYYGPLATSEIFVLQQGLRILMKWYNTSEILTNNTIETDNNIEFVSGIENITDFINVLNGESYVNNRKVNNALQSQFVIYSATEYIDNIGVSIKFDNKTLEFEDSSNNQNTGYLEIETTKVNIGNGYSYLTFNNIYNIDANIYTNVSLLFFAKTVS